MALFGKVKGPSEGGGWWKEGHHWEEESETWNRIAWLHFLFPVFFRVAASHSMLFPSWLAVFLWNCKWKQTLSPYLALVMVLHRGNRNEIKILHHKMWLTQSDYGEERCVDRRLLRSLRSWPCRMERFPECRGVAQGGKSTKSVLTSQKKMLSSPYTACHQHVWC